WRRFPSPGGRALWERPAPRRRLVQPRCTPIEPRPAAIGREAVPGQIDHVDIRRAQRDALFQDVRAFVGERVHAALDDLVLADRPRLETRLAAIVAEHALDLRIGNRLPAARLVAVPAAPA